MLDFSTSEWFIVAIVAFVVLGPEEYPELMQTIGRLVGRIRRTAETYRSQLNAVMYGDGSGVSPQAVTESIRKELRKVEVAMTRGEETREIIDMDWGSSSYPEYVEYDDQISISDDVQSLVSDPLTRNDTNPAIERSDTDPASEPQNSQFYEMTSELQNSQFGEMTSEPQNSQFGEMTSEPQNSQFGEMTSEPQNPNSDEVTKEHNRGSRT